MTLTQTDITPRERGAEMSVLRAVRKRKKVRKLGRVEIMRREDYADLELDAKVELIRSLVPLGLMHVEELLDEEVMALAGERLRSQGRRRSGAAGTAPTLGQWGWRGSACRFGCRGFAVSRGYCQVKRNRDDRPPTYRVRDGT